MRVEITKEEFEANKNAPIPFATSKIPMHEIVRGPYDKKLVEENGKYYVTWKSFNYPLD